MHNIHIDYAHSETFQREAGLREARRNGANLEPRQARAFKWPWTHCEGCEEHGPKVLRRANQGG